MESAEEKKSFWGQVAGFPANYWYANLMEIIERLAFFGVRAIAPLYLIAKSGENGLGLSYVDKGTIYGVWALIQCLLPMVSGGYTERYGYRKSLAVAFVINIIGYLGMAQSRPISDYLIQSGWDGAGFWVFLAAACLIGTGTAIFKPPCQGTVAKSVTEKSSSVGWGVFYWVVNIGGALAPMGAAWLRLEIDWHRVFYAAAIVTALNFLPAFLLFKEPEKTPPKDGDEEAKGIVGVFVYSIVTIFKDLRLVVFLGIFSCFWLMFMQLWDLLPNFIHEWVDSTDVASYFAWFSDSWILGSGQVKPEMIINIDSLAIIALVIPLSWLVGKISKVKAMIIGMIISLVGFVGAGATAVGWVCCAMVVVFAIGEMACSPTFSAYVGLIAPKDKKALYMGYSNIPFAIGWFLGSVIGGFLYEEYGAKANLAMKYIGQRSELVARATQAVDWSDSLEKIPPLLKIEPEAALDLAGSQLGADRETATQILLERFRFDSGQVDNLALLYLALHDEDPENVATKLGKALKELKDDPTLNELGASLADGETELEEINLPGLTHLLPAAVRAKRSGAFDMVRELVNETLPKGERKQDGQIVALLWEEYEDNPGVLSNLALEYIAQSTDLVHDAVSSYVYEHPVEQLDERLKEISKKFGINSGKAFAALASEIGGEAALERLLGELEGETQGQDARLYTYLAAHPRHRFDAVARKVWSRDLAFLRELIRYDEQALAIVLAEIDETGWFSGIFGWIQNLIAGGEPGEVTEEGVNYRKLAGKKDLIQKALAVRNWTSSAPLAAQLLAMNPAEARAVIAADEHKTTKMLWEAYHPYKVWYYLGAIGLLGTIGMILFYVATTRTRAGGAENPPAGASA